MDVSAKILDLLGNLPPAGAIAPIGGQPTAVPRPLTAWVRQLLLSAQSSDTNEQMARLAHATAACAELAVELEERHADQARVTTHAAELVAEVDEKNQHVTQANKALSQANVHASELMATLELRDEQILHLNSALARANAESAELMATLEAQNMELAETNGRLQLAHLELHQKTEQLIYAERQRVMLESLGSACHHLGQPFTAISLHLESMRRANLAPELHATIMDAIQTMDEARQIFDRLREIQEYRVEPFLTGTPCHPGGIHILAL